MTKKQLWEAIQKKASFLCVGLDSDLAKIPAHLQKEKDPLFEFNRRIIDATANYCVAYKPNIAFYESLGSRGWESLEKTLEYIPKDIFTIADAKRGDIGNTSLLYAKAFFETMSFDSITVAPYMGHDSVKPFLEYKNKWVILLALTSNPGSHDFQLHQFNDGQSLYEKVIHTSQQWGSDEQLMYVVGATQSSHLRHIRQLAPEHFLLVPGYGAQGGDLGEVARYGLNTSGGLLVNASRSILYAGTGTDFAQAASGEAKKIALEMSRLLAQYA